MCCLIACLTSSQYPTAASYWGYAWAGPLVTYLSKVSDCLDERRAANNMDVSIWIQLVQL